MAGGTRRERERRSGGTVRREGVCFTGNRELILLVDDEAHVCLLAKLMLCDEGYKVTTAYDGEEAVRVFQSLGSYVSLVILDFIMPGIDSAVPQS